MHAFLAVFPSFKALLFISAEYKLCSTDSVLDESRVKWFKEHILRRGWNAAQFACSTDLEEISSCRSGSIYRSCLQLLGPNLRGERVFNRSSS